MVGDYLAAKGVIMTQMVQLTSPHRGAGDSNASSQPTG